MGLVVWRMLWQMIGGWRMLLGEAPLPIEQQQMMIDSDEEALLSVIISWRRQQQQSGQIANLLEEV
jgi:hypothetical protein